MVATLIGSCGADPGIACRLAWDITHDAATTAAVKVYFAGPVGRTLRIGFVIVLAFVARWLARRVINRITERAATSAIALRNGDSGPGEQRREQRARALGQILTNGFSVVIFAIATLTVLGDLGINLAPLLASAGVLGVALGFGAQNLVRDYLAGIIMLIEDHYGVGDVINAGKATGTVEAITLITTRIRDMNGVVWHVNNGTIGKVGNESQGWSRAVIDYPVPYDSDLSRIRLLMQGAAAGLWADPSWQELMLEEPEVWGAQELSGSEVTMRIVVKTAPLRQWEVARELRTRVKSALDLAEIVQSAPETVEIDSGVAPPPADPGPSLSS
jgi:small conductance mechanosensitive channel